MKSKALRGGGKRLSVRAVEGAGGWRSLERSGNPCTEEADGSGAGFSQEGRVSFPSDGKGQEGVRSGPDYRVPDSVKLMVLRSYSVGSRDKLP